MRHGKSVHVYAAHVVKGCLKFCNQESINYKGIHSLRSKCSSFAFFAGNGAQKLQEGWAQEQGMSKARIMFAAGPVQQSTGKLKQFKLKQAKKAKGLALSLQFIYQHKNMLELYLSEFILAKQIIFKAQPDCTTVAGSCWLC